MQDLVSVYTGIVRYVVWTNCSVCLSAEERKKQSAEEETVLSGLCSTRSWVSACPHTVGVCNESSICSCEADFQMAQ